ncbi:MAG: NAD(P)/FAD-dependent oxidoreductase [Chloroflexi bacterium]|nr:MAG: NAD(P)/FAD-dependent oxidoreductase [Chloroflexota bacterium]
MPAGNGANREAAGVGETGAAGVGETGAAGVGETGASGEPWDAVVVGAGHNGLVCAAYLARAGWEIAPGFRAPALAHTVGRLRPSVVRELRLRDHGLSLVAPEIRAFVPGDDGSAIRLWADAERTAEELRERSVHDAERYVAFDRLTRALGRFMGELATTVPPDIAAPSLGDALAGLRLGRSFRGLGRGDARTLLRVLPMAVADFVAEAFTDDGLRGAIATRGVLLTAMGPWSAGTAGVLLADGAGNDGGAAGQSVHVRGGPAALADALGAALRASGGTIRTDADVASVLERDGRASPRSIRSAC